MTTKLGKVVTHYNNLQRINSHNILKTSSRDKLKTFCLHYHYTYDNQTCQGDYLQWRASFSKSKMTLV